MLVAIGLGSSLGPRRATLELAVRQLGATDGVQLLRTSRWYRTPPLAGGHARGWFLNGVALVDTQLEPLAMLQRCRSLENMAGRRRARHWGDRTLDLDLLVAEGHVERTADLTLPHPAITRRAFVLLPLLEVWPDAVDPTTGARFAAAPPPPNPQPIPVGVPQRGVSARQLRAHAAST